MLTSKLLLGVRLNFKQAQQAVTDAEENAATEPEGQVEPGEPDGADAVTLSEAS